MDNLQFWLGARLPEGYLRFADSSPLERPNRSGCRRSEQKERGFFDEAAEGIHVFRRDGAASVCETRNELTHVLLNAEPRHVRG